MSIQQREKIVVPAAAEVGCSDLLTVGTYGGSTFFAAKRSQSMPSGENGDDEC